MPYFWVNLWYVIHNIVENNSMGCTWDVVTSIKQAPAKAIILHALLGNSWKSIFLSLEEWPII